jgi:uncharacterized protein (TIGR02996 family)
MSTYSDLLQDVLDHPADDGPRLVFADWLDEHGESARADFIRTQIALAECKTKSKKFKRLCEMEKELWASRTKPDNWFLPGGVNFRLYNNKRIELRWQDSHDRLPLLNPEYPTPIPFAPPIKKRPLPVFATARGFIYYVCDHLATLQYDLPTLLAHQPITHAIAVDRYPLSETADNRGPWHWTYPLPPGTRSRHRASSIIPAELIDDRLNQSFDTPVNAILALSAVLIDDAKERMKRQIVGCCCNPDLSFPGIGDTLPAMDCSVESDELHETTQGTIGSTKT